MMISTRQLLEQLQTEISDQEWDAIQAKAVYVSGHNLSVLEEIRSGAICEEAFVDAEKPQELRAWLESYLAEYMSDRPECWKWIILPCIYLAFIARRPLHDMQRTDIRTEETKQGTRYLCPAKESERGSACYYCTCEKYVF